MEPCRFGPAPVERVPRQLSPHPFSEGKPRVYIRTGQRSGPLQLFCEGLGGYARRFRLGEGKRLFFRVFVGRAALQGLATIDERLGARFEVDLERQEQLACFLARRTHRLASSFGGARKEGLERRESRTNVSRVPMTQEFVGQEPELVVARNPSTGQQIEQVAHDRPAPGLSVVPGLQAFRQGPGQVQRSVGSPGL